MGQTRAERVAKTRERILGAAEKLFNANGIRLTGVDAISAEAGLTKVTLYKHFESKDALLAEVLRRREATWRNWFETSTTERASSPLDRLLAMFDVLGEWFKSEDFRGSIFMNVMVENRAEGHPVDEVAKDHMRKNREFIRSLAAEAGRNDSEQIENQLILLFRGAIVSALVEPRPDIAESAREAARKLLA